MRDMSNLATMAEVMFRNLEYEESCKGGIGHIILRGISIPKIPNGCFRFPDKFWSSIRKRIGEEYGIYTTAVFFEEGDTIRGEFYPNCAALESKEDYDEKLENRYALKYVRRFEETFSLQMMKFVDAIESWLLDFELGYVAYCSYLQEAGDHVDPEECGAIVDAFLRRYHFKTDEDDAEKARREKRSKEIAGY